ncbi:MAG: hypothetical protein A2452_03050 [Candidatus Firestonebacteria bacterium RIFOXYC2_FULL_39_67]|nr:MAG: hypothetical protein A2536_02465 [Candidatus Firestonebacteria bacterium RIFOXYD2_FULL_39_29]OGF55430.1 MAG: hypothetical protein A2452_03050 [Candidatus Firestonebacteria bacterium RIFOXYC2_FULL_39_67]
MKKLVGLVVAVLFFAGCAKYSESEIRKAAPELVKNYYETSKDENFFGKIAIAKVTIQDIVIGKEYCKVKVQVEGTIVSALAKMYKEKVEPTPIKREGEFIIKRYSEDGKLHLEQTTGLEETDMK